MKNLPPAYYCSLLSSVELSFDELVSLFVLLLVVFELVLLLLLLLDELDEPVEIETSIVYGSVKATLLPKASAKLIDFLVLPFTSLTSTGTSIELLIASI